MAAVCFQQETGKEVGDLDRSKLHTREISNVESYTQTAFNPFTVEHVCTPNIGSKNNAKSEIL